jgi:hypothetical protein
MVVAHARPGVKLLKAKNLVRCTIPFYLAALLLRRRRVSVVVILAMTAAASLDPVVSRVWILLRCDRDSADTVIARCLAMTRTRFLRETSTFRLTVTGRESSIQLLTPFPSLGLLVFRGDWDYTKARVVRQLLGKSFGPIFPRYVIRLGGRDGQGSQERTG